MVDGVAVLLEVTADLNNPPVQLHQVCRLKMPSTILKLHLQFRTKLVPPRCRYQAAKINRSPLDLEVYQERTSLKSTRYDREKSRYSNPRT
jgi:hypothetical protein